MVLAAVLVLVSSWMVFVSLRASRSARVDRTVSVSPYKNTRPEVRYLGDTSCVGCHAMSAQSFRRHPMGRSLTPTAEAPVRTGDAGAGRPVFETLGLEYSVEDRNGHVFHQETRRDASGRIVARTEAEVQFAVGSGRQGISYLVDHDGFLFESPLSWYSRQKKWDLSPGFDASNYHFERPIQTNCLFCHTNRAAAVPGSLNQYRPPIFQGHAIGCERCHGPGELHVDGRTMVDGKDMTIVNPPDLAPALRDDVCAQCHLAGGSRVVRVGWNNEDYRPGLPFNRFWTVFVQPPDRAEDRFVGQFEQMHQSNCFRASQGKLGCISCHSPHHFPEPEEKVAYYRGRCLECHTERRCSLPESDRLERSRDDDCASCHMPTASSFDIPHAASSNHRIPRIAGARDLFAAKPRQTSRDKRHLVMFHQDRMDADERAAVERDRGVTLCLDGPAGARAALPLLEKALAARSDDVVAWECKGHALAGLGRFGEALAAYGKALTIEPGRESVVVEAARVAAKMNRHSDAVAYFLRAIDINPWRSDYRAELAFAYFYDRNWQASVDACREALRLSSSRVNVRKLLVQCYLKLGNVAAARGELETVLGFDPPDRAELLRSFAVQSRSSTSAR